MSTDRKYYCGVDMGSVSIKAVVVSDYRIMASCVTASGGNYKDGVKKVLDDVFSHVGITYDQLDGIFVTGVGADGFPFVAKQVSDISSQAMGCHRLYPTARTIIDIGGQFTKVARISPEGRVEDFLISEKCASGSGRFLQVIARILQINLDEIGPLSQKSKNPVEFSTNCAVFAESETVSRIAEGALPEDILAGVHRSMASRVSMLLRRLKLEPDVVITGATATDFGLVKAINDVLGVEVIVPESPKVMAAFGAACLAEDGFEI